MLKLPKLFALTLFITFFYSSIIAAELEPGQKEFVERKIQAINTDNFEALKSTIYSESVKKITNENEDVYNDIFTRQIAYQIPQDYTVNVTVIPTDEPLLMDGQLNYPIRPTHFISINFDIAKNKGVTLVSQIVKKDDQWFEVMPEPSQEYLAPYREKKIKTQEEIAQAKMITQELNLVLLDELRKLLADGHKIDAIKRLSEVKNISLSLAKRIIDDLESMK